MSSRAPEGERQKLGVGGSWGRLEFRALGGERRLRALKSRFKQDSKQRGSRRFVSPPANAQKREENNPRRTRTPPNRRRCLEKRRILGSAPANRVTCDCTQEKAARSVCPGSSCSPGAVSGRAGVKAPRYLEISAGGRESPLPFRAILVLLIGGRCCELLKLLSLSWEKRCRIRSFYILLLQRTCWLEPEERAVNDAIGATGASAHGRKL